MFRNKLSKAVVGLLAMAAIVLGVAPATAAAAPLTPELQNTFHAYGLQNKSMADIVVDSAMTYEQAIGDDQVPPNLRQWHNEIKPYLRVIPVVHWGYDNKIHVGQLVINKGLVDSASRLFIKAFCLHFPIFSVIPESAFHYMDDGPTGSMAANNTSAYRPDILGVDTRSEHFKGAAIDINPFTNPEDMLQPDGTRFIDPPNAHYDPAAMGALVKESPLREYGTHLDWEFGLNWGDPDADPPTDFYKVGFFDYQHLQRNYLTIDTEPLPPGWASTASAASAKPRIVVKLTLPTQRKRSEYALAS